MSSVTRKTDDPTGTGHKARWRCPAGHTSWERINGCIWCHACSKATTHNPDADPQHYEVLDTRTGEIVPYDEAKDEWPALGEVPAY